MGTSTSGYIQRRIIKVCEDMEIRYDSTIRDNIGKIYQLNYNYNGFNPISTVKVNGEQQCCDVSRVINKLNNEYDRKFETDDESDLEDSDDEKDNED